MTSAVSGNLLALSELPAGLRAVLSTEDLERRPAREPDFAAENRVLLALAETMAQAPDQVLQKLVDSARELCRAGSAGISLLEDCPETDGQACFRWKATSGGFEPFLGNTLPRSFSPCGSVLDVNQTLLMSNPVRYFGYIDTLPLPVREVLLVPFYRDEKAIGTVWVVSHSDDLHFDSEDARIVKNLSQFAADAIKVLSLAEEKRSLGQHDRDSTHFLATLTHEIRNVMAPMSAALRILKVTDDPGVQVKTRTMMERQLEHLNRLVEDMLDSTRLTSGKLRLEYSVADVRDILRNAVEAARGRIEASQQTLAVNLPPTPLLVRADTTRLAQVFGNLLTNAAKYGNAGGRVTVVARETLEHAIVSVCDTGIGIEPAMLPEVFGLFVQVGNSLGSSQGGLGIGLALVKNLVELHGGTVQARSDGIGHGSEFVVHLPLLNAANSAVPLS